MTLLESKTVQIAVGVVKRIRKAPVPVERLEKPVKAPPKKRVIDRFCVVPRRSQRNFHGVNPDVEPEDRFRLKEDRLDIRWFSELEIEADPDERIDGCSCKDINPPVANLDEWACRVCDPRKEEKIDDHSHIREFVEGIILAW